MNAKKNNSDETKSVINGWLSRCDRDLTDDDGINQLVDRMRRVFFDSMIIRWTAHSTESITNYLRFSVAIEKQFDEMIFNE